MDNVVHGAFAEAVKIDSHHLARVVSRLTSQSRSAYLVMTLLPWCRRRFRLEFDEEEQWIQYPLVPASQLGWPCSVSTTRARRSTANGSPAQTGDVDAVWSSPKSPTNELHRT